MRRMRRRVVTDACTTIPKNSKTEIQNKSQCLKSEGFKHWHSEENHESAWGKRPTTEKRFWTKLIQEMQPLCQYEFVENGMAKRALAPSLPRSGALTFFSAEATCSQFLFVQFGFW